MTICDMTQLPKIGEETLKKLPYWKRWLYKTIKELEAEQVRQS